MADDRARISADLADFGAQAAAELAETIPTFRRGEYVISASDSVRHFGSALDELNRPQTLD